MKVDKQMEEAFLKYCDLVPIINNLSRVALEYSYKQGRIDTLEDILKFSVNPDRNVTAENIREYMYYELEKLNGGAIPYKARELNSEQPARQSGGENDNVS